MTWIRYINENEAEGPVKEIYTKLGDKNGRVIDIYKVGSWNPSALAARGDLFKALMYRREGLSRAERELIAVVASVINQCAHCLKSHGTLLRALMKDDALVEAVVADPLSAPLDDRMKAIAKYTHKLTTTPQAMAESDVNALRSAGLSDPEISDIATIGAYFNMMNRIALGLGIEPEENSGLPVT